MSKLSAKIDYEKKIAEFRSSFEQEAKNLQDIKDSIQNSLQEFKTLAEKKTGLVKVIDDLELIVKEKKELIAQLVVKKDDVISSTKRELDKEKQSVSETKTVSKKLKTHVEELGSVASELNAFVKKEKNARTNWLKQQKDLDEVKQTKESLNKKVDSKVKSLTQQQKDLDNFKQYVMDLYGKLATYVKTATDTINQVNEDLAKNEVPLGFKLPPGEIIEINIDNFNKEYGN